MENSPCVDCKLDGCTLDHNLFNAKSGKLTHVFIDKNGKQKEVSCSKGDKK